MVGGAATIFGAHHHLPFRAEHDALERIGEVGLVDKLVVPPRGQKRRLVGKIREIRTDHPRCRRRDRSEVDVRRERDCTRVHLEDRFAAGAVRRLHRDSPVETTGAKQSLVEDVGPVGRADDDHAGGRVEPVHLGEDLVQRLLAFVIAAAEARDPRCA